MNEIFKTITNSVKQDAIQLIIVLGGLAITLVNLYIASRLAPLESSIALIQQEVHANTDAISENDKYINSIVSLQQQVNDISPRLDRIENKVDSIDGFLRGYK